MQVERLVRWLAPVVERVYAAPAARIDDLRRLEQVAAGAVSRSRFVGDLTLDPPRSTSDLAGPPLLDEDWLVLSTVHSAKGGEWDVVHLLHASDGMFPSDMATGDAESIEEERRLLYVAVTRARHVLEVNAPLRYHHHGPNRLSDAHSYAQVSRFLSPAVQAHMDSAHEGRAHGDGQRLPRRPRRRHRLDGPAPGPGLRRQPAGRPLELDQPAGLVPDRGGEPGEHLDGGGGGRAEDQRAGDRQRRGQAELEELTPGRDHEGQHRRARPWLPPGRSSM